MNSINNPYSPLKIFHHQGRLNGLKAGEQIVPAQVQLIVSDLCNQDCSFCAYRMSGYNSNQLFYVTNKDGSINNNPNRMIPVDKVYEILDDCKDMGIKAIQFTGGGEPTVHPKFTQILNHTIHNNLEFGVVTNGTRLSGGFVVPFYLAKWIRVSIDAGSRDTYSKIRRVSPEQYDRVEENIKTFCKNKPDSLMFGVGFVVTDENYGEVGTAVKKAKEWGVNNIRISAVFQPDDEHYFDSFYPVAADLCKEAKRRYEDENFRVFNLFGERVEDLVQHSPDYEFCGYQQFNTYIGGDLNVYRCCVQSYNKHGLIGSIENQTFKQLWNSEEKQKKFSAFNAKTCNRCQFNNKNKTILYSLVDEPEHVNFV